MDYLSNRVSGMPAKNKINAGIFIAALGIDRLTKYLAVSCLASVPAGSNGHPLLSLYFNRGISLSFFEKQASWALIATLIGICALGFACAKSRLLRTLPGVALMWAGALGNLADRLHYGCVVDWLYVGLHFNLADVWLCLGGLLLLKEYARLLAGFR